MSDITTALVRERIQASIDVKQKLFDLAPLVAEVGEVLVKAYKAGRKTIFMGNGGSAADAQHMAAELVGKFYRDRPALPALALSVNTSILTAIGNDYSYDYVFARQLEALGVAGDVVIGITTSGNSKNVIDGMRAARQKGMVTVGLTGATGGKLRAEVDHCVCVPSSDTPRIQEGQELILHTWCEIIERRLNE